MTSACSRFPSEAAEALFRVVDAAYERRSLAITSNLHPSGFDELMPKTLAAATVDRLLHHAHVLVCEGSESYRLAQATARPRRHPPHHVLKRVQSAPRTSPTARSQHDLNPPAVGNLDGRQRGEKMAIDNGLGHRSLQAWSGGRGRCSPRLPQIPA